MQTSPVTRDAVLKFTLDILREVTGLSSDRLKPGTPFDEIGLQSLAVMAFTARLDSIFPGVPKAFVFDCRSLDDVCAYLIRRYPEKAMALADRLGGSAEQHPAKSNAEEDWPNLVPLLEDTPATGVATGGIAVIGMQGRFPGARSLAAFWDNLVRGVDAVGEIPPDRWALDGFYHQFGGDRQPGQSYSKWGAFLPDVDCFDAQFFGIAPREAALMDPQERLFLETAWHAMEDAALLGERAEHLKGEDGYDIGVFVGITTNTYLLNGPDRWRKGQPEIPTSMPWSAANRVSYCLNLCGPSLTIDTACSSSLVAIHLACESLERGECTAALAGGANLYLHPAKYVQLCQLQMLSPTGRCHSFGEDADGFTPGEGVGVVVLKTLEAARRDRDRILAVIRGTAVNHNGRTNGYTVPKARSQAALVRQALSQAGVSPGNIGYVEAHGTGTKLGDPIEVSGLAEALGGKNGGNPCALGSVKSNIGHLESAAGVSSLVKTILQLQHRKLVPSLHSTRLNPALDLENTRFFVPQEVLVWEPPRDGGLRCAGISSFGAGGTNAHLIVEEAREEDKAAHIVGPMVFTVSARSRDQLYAAAEALLHHLENAETATEDARNLARLAYTLQCGWRHFEHRLALVAGNSVELTTQLRHFLAQNAADQSRHKEMQRMGKAPPFTGFAAQNVERTLHDVVDGDAHALARAWVNGVLVRWLDHWTQGVPRPVSAPPYPFARERHWLRPLPQTPASTSADIEVPARERVVHVRRESTLFRDHCIGGRPLLPGTAYIAHCHALAKAAASYEIVELRDLAWLRPISPNDGDDVSIKCVLRQNDSDFSLELEDTSHPGKVCFRGMCRTLSPDAVKPDVGLLEATRRCTREADVQACYRGFEDAGMVYGPSFRCLHAAWVGKGEALAELRQRPKTETGDPPALLDPAMMDGVLHAASLLLDPSGQDLKAPLVPFSAKRVLVVRSLGRHAFAYVRRRKSDGKAWKRFDFVVFAPDGTVLLEIEDFCFRAVQPPGEGATKAVPDLHLLQPRWMETETRQREREIVPTLLFDTDTALFEEIKALAPDQASVTRLAVTGTSFEIRGDDSIRWNPTVQQHMELLWRALLASGLTPLQLVFNIHVDAGRIFSPGMWDGPPEPGSVFEAIEILRAISRIANTPRFHVRVILSGSDAVLNCLGTAVSGLLRSIHLEMPTISAVVLGMEQDGRDATSAAAVIEEIGSPHTAGVIELKRAAGKRYRRHLDFAEPASLGADPLPSFDGDDVFIVTGGGGAVGGRLALLLAQRGVKQLALTGRGPRNEKTDALLAKLSRRGATAEYWQADCANTGEMARVLSEVGRRLDPVTGVLHCAGVLKDGFFLRQTADDLRESSRAKIIGAHWLDELTAEAPLRWFVLCSALAGICGNVGQSHYAFANTWLDGFAEQRRVRVSRGERSGKTISIAWPLWETSEGMQASPHLVRRLKESGIHPITELDGERIFLATLARALPVIVPVKGEREAVARFLGLDRRAPEASEADSSSWSSHAAHDEREVTPPQPSNADEARADAPDRPSSEVGEDVVEAALIAFLAEALGRVTGTEPAKIDPDAPMEVFGLDSILVMELNGLLEKYFPSLSKTVAFEARSIRGLARLIMTEHKEEALAFAPSSGASAEPEHPTARAPAAGVGAPSSDARSGSYRSTDIAIIGLAGQYPGADTLDGFWDHLVAGHDLVTSMPKRWPDAARTSGDPEKDDRIYARWGAFLDDFDKFDPLFFGISPRDAERMDPQERLFLQTAWHAIEDAGYTPDTLSGRRSGGKDRRRVAVLVGVMYGEYQFYGASAGADRSVPLTNSSYASIANRVSFCLDLDGPSLAVDSMCSSSLYAIHLACELIRTQGCDLAIAGGVNLSLHSYKYLTLCELGFASTDGRCRSFGEGGDGYVPGEGVGVVLLKPLSLAIRDNDHIYGVIRGSDIGHGGRSSGFTVPNAEAQANVIRGAFLRAGIDTARVSYIEGHGTGTSLGDPIEIRGLSKALSKDFPPGRRCPIGSVKSNIGHLESAAGIAALTKVLLQMKHRRLVPSIHSDTLNSNINFAETPFFVQSRLSDWADPDGLPRVAAISSFGAGGSNAHMVVEEYASPATAPSIPSGAQIFPFSARNWKQLAAYLRRCIGHLDRERTKESDGGPMLFGRERFTTAEVASTLFHGRRWFRCRCAVIAEDFPDLREQLARCLESLEDGTETPITDDAVGPEAFLGEASGIPGGGQGAMDRAQSPHEQARAWVQGQWTKPFGGAPEDCRKVPLPGYEFERHDYWIRNTEPEQGAQVVTQRSEEFPHARQAPEAVTEDEITPEAILDRVDRGEMDFEDAQALLGNLIEAEASAL